MWPLPRLTNVERQHEVLIRLGSHEHPQNPVLGGKGLADDGGNLLREQPLVKSRAGVHAPDDLEQAAIPTFECVERAVIPIQGEQQIAQLGILLTTSAMQPELVVAMPELWISEILLQGVRVERVRSLNHESG